MALLKSHSNRTAKQPGYKKTCLLQPLHPVCFPSCGKNVLKDNKKEETKEKMTHSWVSLRGQEALIQGILHMSPHRKRSQAIGGWPFLPRCPGHPGLSCPHLQPSYHHTLSFKAPRFAYPQKILRVSLFTSILYCIFWELGTEYQKFKTCSGLWAPYLCALAFLLWNSRLIFDFPHFSVLPRRKGTYFFSLVQTLTKCGNPSSNHCAL